MADDFCFALLRSTTLQLLQSVGFESVQLSSADTLTDVFGQYIEFLASTVCDFAQLSGRSTGSAFDVMDGLSELSIDIRTLEDWLNSEAKDFEPPWTDQSDPSRVLEGIIDVRKDGSDKPLVYEFLDTDMLDDMNGIDSSPITPTDETAATTSSPQTEPRMPTPLPDYVPSYLPAFPIIATINNDDEMEPNTNTKENESQPIPSSSSTHLPHPLTVKKKKKPITNPFTHITPFEDSLIATDKDVPPPMALSALETVATTATAKATSSTETSPPPPPSLSLSAQRDMALKRMMDAHEKEEAQQNKRRQSAIRSLSHIFQQDTQDDASAGTRLFGRSRGLLDDIVRKVAPPLALATLSTPNLLVDVMTTSSDTTTASSMDKSTSSAPAPNLITLPTKNSLTTSGTHGVSNSGISLTIPARSLSSTTPLSSTPPSATALVSSSSPTTTAASVLPNTDKGARDIFDYDYDDDNQSNQVLDIDEYEKPTTAATSPPLTPLQASEQPSSSGGGPISLASLANKNPKSTKSSKHGRKLTINLSNLQKKADDVTSSASPSQSKHGKLTISLPSSKPSPGSNKASPHPSSHPSSSRSVSSSPSSSSSAPKIRFTLKPPEPAVKQEHTPAASLLLGKPSTNAPPTPTATVTPPSTIPSNISVAPEQEQEDLIRCICDHPTIDYGAFMIACDTCGIWFHGSCVGVSELDQVEEWYCQSCSRKLKAT